MFNVAFKDSLSLWKALYDLPDHLLYGISQEIKELPEHQDIENVVILGMGGSGIVGDIVYALGKEIISVPVITVKDYEIPGFVDTGSLVIAISFSGNTEETLEATQQSFEAGSALVVISKGGELGQIAKSFKLPYVKLPNDITQPRAAVGAMAACVLKILDQTSLLPGSVSWLEKSAQYLIKNRDVIIESAKELAKELLDSFPLIYGATGIGEVVAKRLKNQINENVKAPAFYSTYPELCHNELAGWGQLGDLSRQIIYLVQIVANNEHPQVLERISWVSERLIESVKGQYLLKAKSDNDFTALFELIMLVDAVSLWMAGYLGIDPGPVPALDELKAYLRR
jgi:glucose/mannose-6-phosphate isomerase